MSLKEKITPIDKYIDEALYNKKSGYYMKANPFGKKGDYITHFSPDTNNSDMVKKINQYL